MMHKAIYYFNIICTFYANITYSTSHILKSNFLEYPINLRQRYLKGLRFQPP